VTDTVLVCRRSVDSTTKKCHRDDAGVASLAILAPVGEIDPLGTRRDGFDAFLEQKVEEGYVIQTRSDTHAIIFRRSKGLKRVTSGPDPGRYVVQVDEDGIATMLPRSRDAPRRCTLGEGPPRTGTESQTGRACTGTTSGR
jgi:hypothetical protein